MNKSKFPFRLIEPATLNDYVPILTDVDFGDTEQFLISCGKYLGLVTPRRSTDTDIDIWEQRLVYENNSYPLKCLGITGWYNWTPESEPRLWLSWFGIRSQSQKTGIGRAVIEQTIFEINRLYPEIQWLYVFTDSAVEFYQKCGFENRGTLIEAAANNEVSADSTFKDTDIILRRWIGKI